MLKFNYLTILFLLNVWGVLLNAWCIIKIFNADKYLFLDQHFFKIDLELLIIIGSSQVNPISFPGQLLNSTRNLKKRVHNFYIYLFGPFYIFLSRKIAGVSMAQPCSNITCEAGVYFRSKRKPRLKNRCLYLFGL